MKGVETPKTPLTLKKINISNSYSKKQNGNQSIHNNEDLIERSNASDLPTLYCSQKKGILKFSNIDSQVQMHNENLENNNQSRPISPIFPMVKKRRSVSIYERLYKETLKQPHTWEAPKEVQ